MAINLNSKSLTYAKNLVKQGKVNITTSWSFDTADGNILLGDNENWENYSNYHLAIDTAETPKTKSYYKYPVAKNGMVFRRGVIAAKSRAAAQGQDNVVNAANSLLKMIDKKELSNNMSDIKEVISLDATIDFLNELIGTDKNAMGALVVNRVPCNIQMANHPTVQCSKQNDGFNVGMPGIINGMFGDAKSKYAPIAFVFENGNLLRVERTPEQIAIKKINWLT